MAREGMLESPLVSPDEPARNRFVDHVVGQTVPQVGKETSAQDAFQYLENEIEDLHQQIERLYDTVRNALREPYPTEANGGTPGRPDVSNLQRALWEKGESVAAAKFKILDIIRRFDV